jgi:hypothetical protein
VRTRFCGLRAADRTPPSVTDKVDVSGAGRTELKGHFLARSGRARAGLSAHCAVSEVEPQTEPTQADTITVPGATA